MCQFVSWVERRGKVYFLTGNQLFHTQKGKELLATISHNNLCGHGTIRAYYGIDAGDGVDKECNNFSSPDNFPTIITEAVKSGRMRGIGFNSRLLSEPARVECNKACNAAGDEYNRTWDAAWAMCEKVGRETNKVEHAKVWDAALAGYERVCNAIEAEYAKVCNTIFWDRFAIPENRAGAWR